MSLVLERDFLVFWQRGRHLEGSREVSHFLELTRGDCLEQEIYISIPLSQKKEKEAGR